MMPQQQPANPFQAAQPNAIVKQFENQRNAIINLNHKFAF